MVGVASTNKARAAIRNFQPTSGRPDSITDSQKGIKLIRMRTPTTVPKSDSSTESVRFFGGIRSMILIQNHDMILFQNHGDSLMQSGQFSPRITFINFRSTVILLEFIFRIHIILFIFILESASVLISDLFL